jgi:hypothetical protein
MPRPSRVMPRVGSVARITHFGGETEAAVVSVVADGGHRLSVDSESGERLEFVLSRATAKFVPVGSAHGSGLELLEP